MTDPYYVRLDETPDRSGFRGRYSSTEHPVGPWSPDSQHGGPPSALLTRAMDLVPSGPVKPHFARITAEILSPVPVAELEVRAWIERPGRRIELCGAELTPAGSGQPVMRAWGWRMRGTAKPIDVPPVDAEGPPPAGGSEIDIPEHWQAGYLQSVDWRWVDGRFETPGPATVWTRMRVTLVDGEEPTPTERVMVVADSGSGISSVASPQDLLFINPELTVHFARPPTGEHIWLRARTELDPGGSGLAVSVLGDRLGAMATGAQSLLVEPRV